ncbi:MAG: haloacid dehalogenase type II [Aeromicrobium sp.]
MTTNRHHQTLVFDVLGSLLDEDAGMLAASAGIVGADDAGAFAATWSQHVADAMSDVRAGRRSYAVSESIHADAVAAAGTHHGVPAADAQVREAARFGRRLEPFAEVPEALERLAHDHRLVALTNAGVTQAFEMSGHAGLRWTTLLSGETVGAYKPDPRMYEHAITALQLDPSACLFVAAHPWDLDAAAAAGFRTAYVDRAASSAQQMDEYRHRFEHAEPDLAALATTLLA